MTDDEVNSARLPNPRVGKHAPLMDHSFAALGWLNRAGQAVGSARFAETLDRAQFYLDKANLFCVTPGEVAVLQGLYDSLDRLIAANAEARGLLARGCESMLAADAAEFVELIEAGDAPD